MTATPRVSVVMSAYNSAAKVRTTIESVLRQTFTDFEFLMLDDCSRDDTLAVLEEYARKDSRLRVLPNTVNIGLTRNLIRGVDEARGEYVARIDAGDAWLPEKLGKQVAFLDARPDYVLCASQVSFIMGGQPLGPSDFATEDEELRWRLFNRKGFLSHSTIVFRNILNYRRQFRYSQDLDLYTRLAFLGKLHCLPEELVIFEVGDAGITMDSKFLQRQYQIHGYRLFLQRFRSGHDELDVNPDADLPVRTSTFEKKLCQLGIFFFRRFIKHKLRRAPAPIWLAFFLLSLFVYPPFLKDYGLRFFLIWKYRKNPWTGRPFGPKGLEAARVPDFTPPPSPDAPLVSVVMSFYNSEAKLRRSIESVLAQTFPHFELILIDDASRDRGGELAREYARTDARVRVISAPFNRGLTRNLMQGVEESRGKYIARIDAGDSWTPDKLARQWNFMEAHPDYVLCGSQVNFVMGGKLLGPSSYAVEDAELRKRLFTRESLISHPTIFFRKVVNYRAEFAYSQDLDLYARIAFLGKLHCLPEPLVFCEIGERGITMTKKARQRQYQQHGYRLFLQRFRTGTDELDVNPGRTLPVRMTRFEEFVSSVSHVFFRYFILFKLRQRGPLVWAPFFAVSLLLYPPFLKDYALRLWLIRKYRHDPWASHAPIPSPTPSA